MASLGIGWPQHQRPSARPVWPFGAGDAAAGSMRRTGRFGWTGVMITFDDVTKTYAEARVIGGLSSTVSARCSPEPALSSNGIHLGRADARK